jgi:hypothetical protein
MFVRIALLGSLACILAATLVPVGTELQPEFVRCIVCGSRGWADVLANVLLFAPLGAALALNGRIGSRPVFYAFLLSACIELAQTAIPGRDPSLGDVCFNTLGAVAGQIAARVAGRWLVPGDRAAGRLSIAVSGLAVLLFALTGWLFAPAIPVASFRAWYTADLPELSWYHARVLQTRLGAISFRTDELPNPAEVRRLLLLGAPLHIEAIAGPPVPALGPLFLIEGHRGQELFLVGPDRDDLVFRFRTLAARLRLDQPDLRLRGAFASVAAGDTIRIDIRRAGVGYCITLNRAQRCGIGYTVGHTWALVLYPKHWPPWSHDLLGAAWVAGLALPVGLWTRRRAESLVAVALFVAGLLAVPPLVGLLATPVGQWCGAVVGWTLGLALQRALRRQGAASASGS